MGAIGTTVGKLDEVRPQLRGEDRVVSGPRKDVGREREWRRGPHRKCRRRHLNPRLIESPDEVAAVTRRLDCGLLSNVMGVRLGAIEAMGGYVAPASVIIALPKRE